MTQYWLCITNRDNWNVVQHQKIWGVAERHKNSIAKAVPGDQMLFYLVSESVDGQLKESAVGGVAEVASDVFRDTKRIFKSGTAKKTGEVFPLRVTLSHVRPFREEILFKPLILPLQFIKNKRKWSGHIQGKAMRLIPEGDFTTIVQAEQ